MRRLILACTTALLSISVTASTVYFSPWREITPNTLVAAQTANEQDVIRQELVPAELSSRRDAISSDLAVGRSAVQQEVVRSESAPVGSSEQNDAISSFRDVGQSTSQEDVVRSELVPAQPLTRQDTVSSNLALGQPTSQQDIVNDTVNDLKLQGVPVVSAEILSHTKFNPPLIVQYTLLRASDNNPSSLGEAVGINFVHHAATFAQKRGLIVGGVGIVIVDTQGKVLTRQGTALRKLDDIPSKFDPPFARSDADVLALMDQNVRLRLMPVTDLRVSQTTDGLRRATVAMQVPDTNAANDQLRDLMASISRTVGFLNDNENAQIASYHVILTDPTGQPFLRYMNDISLQYETWSQAKGLKNWGFPEPLPPNAVVPSTR